MKIPPFFAPLLIASPSLYGQHVVFVSVDGLRPDAITSQGSAVLPNFYRLRNEGAFTDSAKTDPDYSNTLPNHVSMITGRQVVGTNGHNWSTNSTPPVGTTIHSNKGSYVSSIFDVASASGKTTSLYASKSKFALFNQSYGSSLDAYLENTSTAALLPAFTSGLKSQEWDLSFLHLTDPDSAGHFSGWGSASYNAAVQTVDGYLGDLLFAIENDAGLAMDTTIILTADHGGGGTGHSDASDPLNNTVPFYVWGAGAAAGADLYTLNPGLSTIRAMDGGNLALDLLGLGAVPGSTANASQLFVIPEPATSSLALLALLFGASCRRR